MSVVPIASDKAPKAVGPYSQALRQGNLIFASGQLPIDPATGKMVEGSIQDKARQCLVNLAAVAQAGRRVFTAGRQSDGLSYGHG